MAFNANEVKEKIFYLIDSEGEFSPSHMIGLQFALAKTAETALTSDSQLIRLGISKFACTMLKWCYDLEGKDDVMITPEMIDAMKKRTLRVDKMGCFFGECFSAISEANEKESFADATEKYEDVRGFVIALSACLDLTYKEAKKMEDAA